MTETEELELLNKDFNNRMSLRPTTNLITCTNRCSRGYFYSMICDPEKWMCEVCKGIGYVNAAT